MSQERFWRKNKGGWEYKEIGKRASKSESISIWMGNSLFVRGKKKGDTGAPE